jgi:diguanylate cyclase (GGDEF)-like protein
VRRDGGDAVPDHPSHPGESYRRLLREALAAAAEARGELAAKTREADRLRRLSLTDEVTGLLNRRGFDGALERAIARLQRTGETGLLLVIDLNDFKAINDAHGHQAGDLVLGAVATLLTRHTRATDAVARLGGDEFAVILGGADPIDGRVKAARLAEMLNGLSVTWKEARIPVRASVGIVDYAGGDMAEEIVHRADLDMYHKKRLSAAATRAAVHPGPRNSGLIQLPER